MSEIIDHTVNLLIIGDSNVGKSNICIRFIKDEYYDYQMPTIGIDYQFKLIKLENKTVNIKLWDTAGQEKFQSMVKRVFKQADGVVLVYDVTSAKSFANLDKWLKQIKQEMNPEQPVLLIANKVDLEVNREVSAQQGLEYAKKNQMFFFETSAKKNKLIKEAFEEIIKQTIVYLNSKDVKQGNNQKIEIKQIISQSYAQKETKKSSGCC